MRPSPVPALHNASERGWQSWIRRASFFAVIWWVLGEGAADSWLVGIPAIAASTWLSFIFWPGPPLSLRGLLRFAPWFAHQSLVGGIDVALRALRRDLPLHPGLVQHRVRLPEGGSRVAFANSISMLPGTLSADLDGDLLVIHALNIRQDLASMAADIEVRIAAVFGVRPGEGREGETAP